MPQFLPAGLALALALPLAALDARADTPSEMAALRQEIGAIRAAYEARLRALEQRLQAAEAGAAAATAAGAAAAAAAVAAPAAPAAPTALAAAPAVPAAVAPAIPAAGANAFNPALSLILAGGYTRSTQDPARYAITGFLLPAAAEVGPGTRGFSLAESELGLSASIDPWWRGVAHFALHPDNSVSVEEAFVQTTALGSGLVLKAGRFLSGVGYLNAQHAHAWDFADSPLAYQALLGSQYADDGLQLAWLAPTDQYLELGLELGRGRSFPGGDNGRNGAGMLALTAHTGGDWGDSHSWRAGMSALHARADDQALQGQDAKGNALAAAFSGSTRLWVADALWKWAPDGNATRTSFKLQAEYLRSSRNGSLDYDIGNGASNGAYRAAQSGWYLQGVYQFMPRWRLGLRTERLDAGSPDYGPRPGLLDASGYRPGKHTLMVDFNPSEFSRLRLQVARDEARQGGPDQQLMLQYQMSLGAHGAHRY